MIRAKYRDAFSLHRDVATTLESAVRRTRRLADGVSRAADMLMVQGYKAHGSVYLLAVRAQVEDAATITRKLLEIAVQTIYITADDNADVCRQRAGRYLAYLWNSVPQEWRAKMPDRERQVWEAYHADHGRLLSERSRSWGPNVRSMFEEIGQPETYEQDYSLLSRIAHGTPPSLVQDYAQPIVPLRDDTFVPMVLVFASRYYLATAGQWNRLFRLVDEGALASLIERASRFYASNAEGPPLQRNGAA